MDILILREQAKEVLDSKDIWKIKDFIKILNDDDKQKLLNSLGSYINIEWHEYQWYNKLFMSIDNEPWVFWTFIQWKNKWWVIIKWAIWTPILVPMFDKDHEKIKFFKKSYVFSEKFVKFDDKKNKTTQTIENIKTNQKSIKNDDNLIKIWRLEKKIEDLKNRGTWKQPYTWRRQRILDGYIADIEKYEAQIKELWWNVNNNKDYQLEQKIKWQLLKKIPWYFPTPIEVVMKMVELSDIQDWEHILEPSAWTWNIIDWILETWKNITIIWIEKNYSNFEILIEKYKNKNIVLSIWDFIEESESWIWWFDKILMNPPFENKQDQKHILKAFELLKEWWILVAICSTGVLFRSDYQSLRDLILKYWEYFGSWEQYLKLDNWTFKMSGTMVNSILIVLKK